MISALGALGALDDDVTWLTLAVPAQTDHKERFSGGVEAFFLV